MISVSFEAIVPAPFTEGVLRLYILNEARKIITQIKKDFARTVKTWETKPKFEQDLGFTTKELRVGVFTEDKNYERVSEGTDAKPRVARKGKALTILLYDAKSPPGQIDAQPGGAHAEPIIFRKYALNAGKIRPRKFDELVYDIWEDKMAEQFQAAFDAAALKTGYAI